MAERQNKRLNDWNQAKSDFGSLKSLNFLQVIYIHTSYFLFLKMKSINKFYVKGKLLVQKVWIYVTLLKFEVVI